MAIQFKDNTIRVIGALDDAAIQFLEEAVSELQSQAEDNTPVDTGQLKGAWDHKVFPSKKEAVVGNPLEYAIWNELGTGEFALEGNGRKGGWHYYDEEGVRRFTYGNKPRRMLWNAYKTLRNPIIQRAKQIFGERMK